MSSRNFISAITGGHTAAILNARLIYSEEISIYNTKTQMIQASETPCIHNFYSLRIFLTLVYRPAAVHGDQFTVYPLFLIASVFPYQFKSNPDECGSDKGTIVGSMSLYLTEATNCHPELAFISHLKLPDSIFRRSGFFINISEFLSFLLSLRLL